MTDMNAVQENLREWLENPAWAEYYSGAPSDRCREFIALEFYCSEYEDDEEAWTELDEIEDTLDAEELRHLYRWCGNNPRKGILARKIAEREAGRSGD